MDINKYSPQSIFKSKNDVNINYYIKGTGEKFILFLHGFGLNIYSWEIFLNEPTDERFTYVFLDLKGFGFSDKPLEADYSIAEQTNLVNQLLAYLNIKELSIVSHSYGGIISLSIINDTIRKRNDLKINKLVLIDVPAFKNIKPNFIKILQSNVLSFLTLHILPTNLITKHTIKSTFYNIEESERKHFERYNYFFKIKGINNSMKKLASQITPKNIDEIENCLELIENEVLIIWGENDKLIPIHNGIKLHSKIKKSLFKVIEKCGHVPHEEKPNETYKIIKNFLS